jgi:hypothetical protein
LALSGAAFAATAVLGAADDEMMAMNCRPP